LKRLVLDDPPPFLGNWRRVYISVLLYLVALITLFWLFGKAWA
jgi:hypothetical protein